VVPTPGTIEALAGGGVAGGGVAAVGAGVGAGAGAGVMAAAVVLGRGAGDAAVVVTVAAAGVVVATLATTEVAGALAVPLSSARTQSHAAMPAPAATSTATTTQPHGDRRRGAAGVIGAVVSAAPPARAPGSGAGHDGGSPGSIFPLYYAMATVGRMYVWDEEWLARRTEPALDPDLAIIDPHHHLWERERMTRYLVADLHDDTGGGHRVEATVFVECAWGYRTDGPEALRPVGETETVAALAATSAATGAEIRGIVSFADMRLGDAVAEVLDAHVAAGGGRFRGIRHATAFDDDRRIRRTHTLPTPGLMGDATFRRGVARLAAMDLSFDAWLYHPQIPELTALARAVPDGSFVLDHLGGPLGIGPYEGRRAEILDRWRVDLAELASCPNVTVKLGGIGMTTYGLGFDEQPDPPSSDDLVAAWGKPIAYAIEQFGSDRCMFESNFPVDKMSCSYVTLWNAFKKIAADASPAEKADLFQNTAARVYRVE
jgi:L-fuconolactonase